MCFPKKKNHKKLKAQIAEESPKKKAEDVVGDCGARSEASKPKPPPARLTSLSVTHATLVDGVYATTVAATQFVDLEATTTPNTPEAWAQINWGEVPGLQDGDAANRKRLPRDGIVWPAIDISPVLAGDDEQSVSVAIFNILSVTSDLPKLVSPGLWKGYEKPGATTTLTAVTSPNQAEVWRHLTWSEGRPAGRADQQIVDIPVARDATVTARLGTEDPPCVATAQLHICKWPTLAVQKLAFTGGFEIDKDTLGPFPREWKQGNPQQPPLGYQRNVTVQITATFDVVDTPTENESVPIRGEAVLGAKTLKWTGVVNVKKAGGRVTTAELTSSRRLPDEVQRYDAATFRWEFQNADKSAWITAGQTSQVLYSTLGASKKSKVHWTYLDVSCRAARGTSDVDTFVSQVFTGFSATTGDGKGIVRLRDGKRLTYYLQGRDTPAGQVEPRVWTPAGILETTHGTGRCGGWSAVLLYTHAIHGVAVAREVNIYPATEKVGGAKVLFIVRNCTATGAGTLPGPFPYEGQVDFVKADGIPGQGKTNPHFVFGDHVLDLYKGVFYDPSYGVTMPQNEGAYETAAIAGLGSAADGVGFDQGTTPQVITKPCSPGWVEVTYDGTRDLNAIAAHYGAPSGKALYDDPHNSELKAARGANPLQNGDKIYVPRSMATQNFSLLRWEYK